MDKKEYVSPVMSVLLLDESRVLLAVSLDSSGGDEGIPDWE